MSMSPYGPLKPSYWPSSSSKNAFFFFLIIKDRIATPLYITGRYIPLRLLFVPVFCFDFGSVFSDPAKNHNIVNSLFKVAIYCGSTLMRTILVFFWPCFWTHVLLVLGISRSCWRPCFFLHVPAAEPAESEQLSRLRGFAASGLCYTVPCGTLSKGLTVDQCKTLF